MIQFISYKIQLIKFYFFIQNYVFITGQGAISTEPIVAIIDFDNIVYSTHQMEEKSTFTIPKITESNIRGNFENRIQNIWQFMLIMLAVFSVMALTYLGKCVHRQWTSRSLQVSNIRTSSPNKHRTQNMKNLSSIYRLHLMIAVQVVLTIKERWSLGLSDHRRSCYLKR